MATTSADYIQVNLRFRTDQDLGEQLKATARAEDLQSLLRCFIVEGLRARMRTDRIHTRV